MTLGLEKSQSKGAEKKLGVHIRLIPVIDGHGRLIDVLDLLFQNNGRAQLFDDN